MAGGGATGVEGAARKASSDTVGASASLSKARAGEVADEGWRPALPSRPVNTSAADAGAAA